MTRRGICSCFHARMAQGSPCSMATEARVCASERAPASTHAARYAALAAQESEVRRNSSVHAATRRRTVPGAVRSSRGRKPSTTSLKKPDTSHPIGIRHSTSNGIDTAPGSALTLSLQDVSSASTGRSMCTEGTSTSSRRSSLSAKNALLASPSPVAFLNFARRCELHESSAER